MFYLQCIFLKYIRIESAYTNVMFDNDDYDCPLWSIMLATLKQQDKGHSDLAHVIGTTIL